MAYIHTRVHENLSTGSKLLGVKLWYNKAMFIIIIIIIIITFLDILINGVFPLRTHSLWFNISYVLIHCF
jgi:hypothetical protein